MTRPHQAHLPPAGDGRIFAPRLAAIGCRGTHDRCQHRRDGCRPDAGPVTGQVRCRAGHRPAGVGVPGLDRGRAGLPSVTSGPPSFLAWLGGLSSSPGRGLAGASPLRFELPSWRARSGPNRATRLHSHWLNQDFFGPVCPLFARNPEKPRKKSGRGGCQACHSLRILSPRRRSRKRPSRPGSPPTGRQLDN